MSNSRVDVLQPKRSYESPNKATWAKRPGNVRLREDNLLPLWFDHKKAEYGGVSFEPVSADLDKGMHMVYLHLAPEVCFLINK